MQQQWPDGSYTLAGVADLIGVHIRTVHTWIARGMLVPSQVYKGGPVKLGLTAEQIGALRDYVARVRRPRRARGTCSTTEDTRRTEAHETLRRPPPALEAEPGAHDLRQHTLPDTVTTTLIAVGGHRHIR
jgi:hypothetical protein